MGWSLGSGIGRNHVVSSFLAGAALPTLLLFVLASDRVGEQLVSISSWGNGALQALQAAGSANASAGHAAALAQEQQEKFPGLAKLLPDVATDDRTVIITSVNEAWARPGSLLDLFRESFKNGDGIAHLLDHVLVVSVDPAGFDRCKAVHPHCYLLEVTSANLSSANRFMSKGYLELVWAKLSLQQRVLELGYNFLFTDADIMWFRDPFRHIKLYADMAVSCDRFSGNADDVIRNAPNTGFYYVKSTNRTVEMLRYWQASRSRFRPDHDQGVFNSIKPELASKLHVKIVFLDTTLFGGFCQYRDDVDRVCTMHANCCVGLENKVHDLRNVVADWKNYTRLTPPEKKGARFKWTFPAKCKASM
ncbi:hypothetical protein GUJ93_ZPchr0007g6353 [Zizania palustris]|uniref:Nucleotide-diphospho-sugar transferase domain-containing protein n=1 Tax=Zizania palustris TaxID=103762 RepID=A0A8J5T2G4_ZIZPA|nr:hypothetical protein GUJ93_ZPchr0007g6353 [Zizania palustris]